MNKYDDKDYKPKGIRQSLIDFVDKASTRERARLYYFQYKGLKESTINDEEAEYIISKTLKNKRRAKEWKRLRDLRFALSDIAHTLGEFVLQWENSDTICEEAVNEGDMMCIMQRICEEGINTIKDKDERIDRAKQWQQDLTLVKGLYGAHFVLKINDDGTCKFEYSGHIAFIRSAMKDCEDYMRTAKTACKVIEDFCDKYECRDFLDDTMLGDMKRVRKDGIKNRKYWSKSELRRRRERGEEISKTDEYFAVYPDYEALPIDEDFYKSMALYLEYLYRLHKKEEDYD